jgi:hypothetical protein
MDYDNFELKPLVATGTWTSREYDFAKTPTTQGKISWQQDNPTGTRIEIQTATSNDGINWSNWSQPYSDSFGSVITSPARRYIRTAVTMYSDPNHEYSPVLKEIYIEYPDAVPLKPTLNSGTHAAGMWNNQSAVNLEWSMPVGNPAPESTYKYWLSRNGALALSGAAAVNNPGQPHSFSLNLPTEGIYLVGLTVTADTFSGGLTSTADVYTLRYDATPPGETTISSTTHPPLLFTNNNSPVFQLAATDSLSGISGYAAVLDKSPTGDPGNVVNADQQLRFSRLDNGTFYLHARAIDMAGNQGPVSHYGIRIDFNGSLLSQDYVKATPNPVRGNTAKLEYELAAPAVEVVLEFMNSQGELLKSVEGGRIVGKNYYNWDIGNLANGVYLFRVKAKSSEDGKAYQVVRKVAVVR